MNFFKHRLIAVAAIVLLMLSARLAAASEELYQIMDLRNADRYFVSLSLERVNELTRSHFGSMLNGSTEHDIPLLQRLLSDKVVAQDNTVMLQAMGIALGEVLKGQRELKWVRYLDTKGTSRALQLKHENYFIYPVTLISRRVSAGIEVDIAALYSEILQKLDDYIEQHVYAIN